MSRISKGSIFLSNSESDGSDITFFEVLRSTTNTCEVVTLQKKVVAQNDYHQFVEPDVSSHGSKKRCKVVNSKKIMLNDTEHAVLWDGLPVRQITRIFLFGSF